MSAPLLLLPALLAADPDAAPRPEAAQVFAARVQPIVMNLCARCHAKADYPGDFKLRRAAEGYADHAAARTNLAVAARAVRADAPAKSPLLEMALAAHGGAREAPLPNAQHPAYRTLAAWANAVWPRPAVEVVEVGPASRRPSPPQEAGGTPAPRSLPAPAEVAAPADPFGPAALREFLARPR